jgi:hypothetical protein
MPAAAGEDARISAICFATAGNLTIEAIVSKYQVEVICCKIKLDQKLCTGSSRASCALIYHTHTHTHAGSYTIRACLGVLRGKSWQSGSNSLL